MQITNGTVEYSRTVKPADYESKAAKVTLTFAVDEGEASPDAVVARVFDMAMGEVHRRLGLKVEAKVVPYTAGVEVASSASGRIEPETAGITVVKAKKEAAAAKVEEPKIRGEIVKGPMVVVDGTGPKREAAAAPQENPTPMTTQPGKDTSPAAVSSPSVSPDPLAIVAPATAPVSDNVVEITDSDLHTAVHQTLDRGVTAIQVRNLTDTFTGVVGQSMRTLPQDQRPAFLAALKELQPE